MKNLILFIKSDLYRYNGKTGVKYFLKIYYQYPLFRLLVWNRISKYLENNSVILLSKLAHRKYKHICRRCGVEIPLSVNIGYACKINHGYGLVINSKTIIGDNVTLLHNLTFSEEKGKAPIIGNCVRFTPGVVVVGGVKIGNNSVIGANCVVTKDIPHNCVSVGIPNRIINKKYKEDVNRYYWNGFIV